MESEGQMIGPRAAKAQERGYMKYIIILVLIITLFACSGESETSRLMPQGAKFIRADSNGYGYYQLGNNYYAMRWWNADSFPVDKNVAIGEF